MGTMTLFLECLPQTESPQLRQWWRVFMSENSLLQMPHRSSTCHRLGLNWAMALLPRGGAAARGCGMKRIVRGVATELSACQASPSCVFSPLSLSALLCFVPCPFVRRHVLRPAD